jgi:hypothetical protein
MTSYARYRWAALSVSLVALLIIQPAIASFPVGGISEWTLVAPPVYSPNSVNIAGATVVNYRNNLNTSVVGIVFAVSHNGIDQTVTIGSATLAVGANLNATAYPEILNPDPAASTRDLPPGTYVVTVFAVALNGVAISNSTSVVVTVPNQ